MDFNEVEKTIITIEEKINRIKQILLKVKEIEVPLNGIEFLTLQSCFSAQKKGAEVEAFIIETLKGEKIQANEDCGDFNLNGKNFELKVSFTNSANTMNLRQIRLWQEVDFYLCIFVNEIILDGSFFWLLTKQQMEECCKSYGSFTHGTKKINNSNNFNEYSITIPLKETNKKFKEWQQYLNEDLKKEILYGKS